MMSAVRRVAGGAVAAVAVFAVVLTVNGQSKVACDPDNGGIKLPDGFCALVVANDLGPARHIAVAQNGDVYVAVQSRGGRGQPETGGGVIALRDANGDGKFEIKEPIGTGSTTGVALHNGYLYLAHPKTIERYKMTAGQLKPTGAAEIVVKDLPPDSPQHNDKGLTFDDRGSLYINVGAPSNACQQPDRNPGVKGVDPCPILEKHGGIWKFDENKLGQTQADGTKFATGMRQFPAIAWHDGAVYVVMNNRDQLDVFWPEKFTAKDNAERPAEPMYRAVQGSNFGWPYCFFDFGQKKNVLNPEYGGDGKEVGRCATFTPPVAAFPAHWAPVDVMFYSGSQFPKKYQGGAFIAFHGSWNRLGKDPTGAPIAQDGYNVTFQPFSGEKPSGAFEVFASGFAGKDPLMNPNDAAARADGVAQAPDGSLYIGDSQKGKLWRVIYKK
jgi:glucose/arabinose dehydrogenase